MTNLGTDALGNGDLKLTFSSREKSKSSESIAQEDENLKQSNQVYPVTPLEPGVKLLPGRRVVILIPNVDVDEAGFCKVIRASFPSYFTKVLLVSVIHNKDEESINRRRLASLAALIREPGINVDTQIIWGKSWLKACTSILQDKDVIICPEGLFISVGIRKKVRLCHWLSSTSNLPVYSLTGYFVYPSLHIARSVQRGLYWMVLGGFFVGFFIFQINIEALPDNWFQKTLEGLVILGEVSLIYLWTSVMG